MLIQAPVLVERSYERTAAREMEADMTLVVSVPQVHMTKRGEEQTRRMQEERERHQYAIIENVRLAKLALELESLQEEGLQGMQGQGMQRQGMQGQRMQGQGMQGQEQGREYRGLRQTNSLSQTNSSSFARNGFTIEGHNHVGDKGHAANRPGSPKRAEHYYSMPLGARSW
jgi:hypothetical protein